MPITEGVDARTTMEGLVSNLPFILKEFHWVLFFAEVAVLGAAMYWVTQTTDGSWEVRFINNMYPALPVGTATLISMALLLVAEIERITASVEAGAKLCWQEIRSRRRGSLNAAAHFIPTQHEASSCD